jgi:hypothetical protein
MTIIAIKKSVEQGSASNLHWSLKFKIINQWSPVKKIFFKFLYFKNSSIKIKIIIWLLQLIYIKNYNIRSMKIKVEKIKSIAFHGPDPDRGPSVADPCCRSTQSYL